MGVSGNVYCAAGVIKDFVLKQLLCIFPLGMLCWSAISMIFVNILLAAIHP